MRPIGKPMMKKSEAQAMLNGIKNYGKNVVGGAKIVGGAIKSGINKVGTKIADDLFGSPEKDKAQRAAGKALNDSYSGFKYGVQIKKKTK